MLTPAVQCGCGCSVSFGVKFILSLHTIANVVIIAVACVNIIGLKDDISLGWTSTELVYLSFYCLAGLPIIVMAFMHTASRLESAVRFYFLYLFVTCLLILFRVLYSYVIVDVCADMPVFLVDTGSAFACGVMRVLEILVVLVTLSIEAYFLYIVYSYCEDMMEGGGAILSDLVVSESTKQKKFAMEEESQSGKTSHVGNSHFYDGLVDRARKMADGASPGPSNAGPINLSAARTGLFGGKHHEMNYPPS